ncbi:MAG: hypothetical protein HQ518_23265 [Rhodopirellula sp.]|nr:hypothetical protein [Rhodopirellula sp.]
MTTPTSQLESNQQPDLLDVLQRRREYCRAMLELSRRQAGLIDDGNFTDLLQLIAQKQRVLEHLAELGRSFGGIVEFWKSVRDQLAVDLRTRCQSAIDDAESLLSESMVLEKQGTAALSQRRDETQGRLKEIGEASSGLSGRGKGSAPRPRFLDVSR